MNLFYTAYAKADLASSFTWYETQRKGLGFDFLDCVEIAIKAIIRNPESSPKTHQNFHRKIIRRFPFSIFYTIESENIVVHAVFDNRQDPEKRP